MPQDWKELYQAALLETDRHQLVQKVELAMTVLRQNLRISPHEPSSERERMENALRMLDMLRRIEFRVPA